MASDALITVSQTYAREIITQPQEARADLFLAKRSEVLRGIVNGVDATDWDPETDTHLARTYGPAEVTAGKAANKRLLLRKLRMPAHEGDPPLVRGWALIVHWVRPWPDLIGGCHAFLTPW